jgi:hypothetical protein
LIFLVACILAKEVIEGFLIELYHFYNSYLILGFLVIQVKQLDVRETGFVNNLLLVLARAKWKQKLDIFI